MTKQRGLHRVLIAAAGTGGHIVPGLALADLMRARGIEVCWIGGDRPLERRLVGAAGLSLHSLPISGVRGKGALALLRLPWCLLHSAWRAWALLFKFKPQVVVTFGGYVTGPVGLAAWLMRRPLFLHEQNAIAGMTNRCLLPLVKQAFTAFPDSFSKNNSGLLNNWLAKSKAKITVVGNPLPDALLKKIKSGELQRAGRSTTNPLRILVTGGSQGAMFLNKNLPPLFSSLQQNNINFEVVHQVGAKHQDAVCACYQACGLPVVSSHVLAEGLSVEAPVRITEFIDDMVAAYAWADVVLCRAGAMTVSEIASCGLPAIFFPLPAAVDDHQWFNAQYLVQHGAAYVMRQADFDAQQLQRWLSKWAQDPAHLQNMADTAARLAKPHAQAMMLDRIEGLV